MPTPVLTRRWQARHRERAENQWAEGARDRFFAPALRDSPANMSRDFGRARTNSPS